MARRRRRPSDAARLASAARQRDPAARSAAHVWPRVASAAPGPVNATRDAECPRPRPPPTRGPSPSRGRSPSMPPLTFAGTAGRMTAPREPQAPIPRGRSSRSPSSGGRSRRVQIGASVYDRSRIPEVVLRESIASALAHRSYEIARTPVRIELRPASIRFISPGGLARAGDRAQHQGDQRRPQPGCHPGAPPAWTRRRRGTRHRCRAGHDAVPRCFSSRSSSITDMP